jgi:hypothetical protein
MKNKLNNNFHVSKTLKKNLKIASLNKIIATKR